jgi:hypothetical protein
MARSMVRQDWGKWNLDIVFPMVYHNFYTGDVSFISDCTLENARDKNPMTTLYCGMTATNGPAMFDCMNEALRNGARGVSIFTVGGLRSPEIRARFKAYADSARAARAAMKDKPEVPVTRQANADPFANTGIMKAADFRMLAFLSLASAYKLPEVKKTDAALVGKLAMNAMQVNKAADYLGRLTGPQRRNPEAEPAMNAIAGQFRSDMQKLQVSLGEYKLIREYGATKYYQVTEQNSKVVFDVNFYFYGGIISGWSVSPEKTSYEKYKNAL